MPYDPIIEERISELTDNWQALDKKKMFGGICYLLNGNMCFGIYKEFIIIRAGQELADSMLEQPNIRPFDITGKSMKGWFVVGPEGYDNDEKMLQFLRMGREFALTLPPK